MVHFRLYRLPWLCVYQHRRSAVELGGSQGHGKGPVEGWAAAAAALLRLCKAFREGNPDPIQWCQAPVPGGTDFRICRGDPGVYDPVAGEFSSGLLRWRSKGWLPEIRWPVPEPAGR